MRTTTKYKVNEQIFDEIDSQDKAYWLGFLSSDGHIGENSIIIEISNKDVDHLYKFQKFMMSEHPIKTTRKDCSLISINSRKLCKAVRELGFERNKTFTLPQPDQIIPTDLISHFYRGWFDGDGWLSSRKMKNSKNEFSDTDRRNWEICFCSADLSFITQFKVWINTTLDNKLGYLHTRKNVHTLSFGGNKSFTRVSSLLYNDASTFLTRKFDLVQAANQNIQDTAR